MERVEPGVPGVKLQFSNGASVVTDIDGKYSLPGLPPGSHVIAVSTPTLPATVKLRSTTARDALSPQSRYLRLLPGQVVSEYFAVSPREGVSREEVLAELESRRQAYAENIAASKTVSVPERLNPGGEEWVDYFGRLSSSRREAAKTTETQIVAREQSEEESAESGKADAPQALALDRTRDLEAEIRGLSPALGFLDLEADSLVNSDIVSVRIKGPAEGKLGLNLNGEPVSDGQVGQRVVYASGGVQAAEYVAIRLEGGRNRLEATFSDPFGNVRERNEITVLAPGRPARIELVAPPAAFADPASAIPVLIRFVDADGVPTHAAMDVTLETSGRGRWGGRGHTGDRTRCPGLRRQGRGPRRLLSAGALRHPQDRGAQRPRPLRGRGEAPCRRQQADRCRRRRGGGAPARQRRAGNGAGRFRRRYDRRRRRALHLYRPGGRNAGEGAVGRWRRRDG
ncbi:hypothetical protein [Sinorhizobium meliloti]